MIRRPTALLALLLLPGCILNSKVPLIDRADPMPGLTDGYYQPYFATDEAKLRTAPRLRKLCLSPGYSFTVPDANGKLQAPVEPLYCPFEDPGKPPTPPTALVLDGTDYRFDADTRFTFMRLNETTFLLQSHEPQPAEGAAKLPDFTYFLARVAPNGIDLALLPCNDFPSIARPVAPAASSGPDAPLPKLSPSLQPESQMKSCEATALAPIRPELDAEVDKLAKGRLPILVLLRRVDGAAAGAPAKPPR